MAFIRDIARVCKSKNAGPFELTIDVVFDNADTFPASRKPACCAPSCSPGSMA